ncbi:MAG TPA: SgcJ/EcaC family oxidoreductase [Candidatus Acidoferrales bacterium]|jgi:uncharacterized protein (TIGR02246 family)|nr:SgcJ/EcaC family oxidoreductase [Candidatus Acidoferrales bacterium]
MISVYRKARKSKLTLLGCAALMLFASACGEKTPPDTRATDANAIRDLDTQWSKTAAASDVDGAVSYYTDDATLMPPNAPAATGKQAIRAVWAGLLIPGNMVSWQTDKVEVARSSDLAYSTGEYQATLKDAQGKEVMDRGKYVEVWKKQADGKWKVVADMYNSDFPAAPAEKKVREKPRRGRSRARATRRKKRA